MWRSDRGCRSDPQQRYDHAPRFLAAHPDTAWRRGGGSGEPALSPETVLGVELCCPKCVDPRDATEKKKKPLKFLESYSGPQSMRPETRSSHGNSSKFGTDRRWRTWLTPRGALRRFRSPPPGPRHGSFSAVSKPNFVSKYALESSRRDLHNALLCTALKSHFFQKIARILPKFTKKFRNLANFAEFCNIECNFWRTLTKK